MWACQNVGLPKLVHVKMRVSITCFIAKMWQHIFFFMKFLVTWIWLKKYGSPNSLGDEPIAIQIF
jgi:hypothetical protein